MIVAPRTPVALSETGSVGTVSYAMAYGVTSSTTTVADGDWNSSVSKWLYNTGYNYYLLKVTATSVDGTNTDVKYIAINPVATYTVTIDNNSSYAVKVTMGNETKIVAASTGTHTFTAVVASGEDFDVSYVVDGGNNVKVTFDGNVTTGFAFDGVATGEGVTNNTTITFANP